MSKVLNKVSYIDNLKKAIADVADHPYHAGFKMQAHHILSREAFFRVDGKRGEFARKVEAIGYNINLAQNLVFLPCELEGACHLQVPLHRGNHTYVDHNNKDGDVYRPYHAEVARRIESKIRKFVNDCDTRCATNAYSREQQIQKMLDSVSKKVLKLVADYKLPLNRMHTDFKLHNPKGCGNLVNIGTSEQNCKKNRDHSLDLQHREHGGTIDFPSVAANQGKSTYSLRIYE
ncbi:MAG: AHH domain-containing protein [Ketobacteraceae bacterium]|nr:AHH domain-containing protein [Ketobacteraceae bacterium]